MSALLACRASAPGKTILMGEHAAVYGRPALVAAVDRRLFATLAPWPRAGEPGLLLVLPALGVEEQVSWPALADYARERKLVWEGQQHGGAPADFARLRGEDRAHVVKAALGELLLFAGRMPTASGRLEVESELPLGSGFGSSAACATAVLLAAAAALEIELGTEQVLQLALEVERRQHGSPSGIDNATVLHGGILWVERDGDGRLKAQPLAARAGELLPGLRFFQSGEPAESTGAVVAAVRQRRSEDEAAFTARLDDMAAATRALRQELESGAAETSRLIALFRRFEGHLEAFGVVPEAIRRVIREVERQGGAAKISGAGSLSGPGAGSLLVLEPGPGLDLAWPATFNELNLRLGAPGARREP